ncbi:MAG: shikimate kinase [Nitratireductor sp.]|nr:shikimate kinase [Nitratireductor sp.]
MERRPMPNRNQKIHDALGDRCLVFVGMMGSGKTAIGRLVAAAIGIPFYDSDQEIVTAANMDIPEIFERHGEGYFRAGEERVIQRLLSEGPSVISLGGGAFLSEATRAAIEDRGMSIWLKADLDLLMSRVMRRPGTRPLLKTADPRATMAALMETREPVYGKADIHVPSSSISKNHTRDAALAAIAEQLGIVEPDGDEDGQ